MGFDKIKNDLYSAGKYVTENATMASDFATKKINLKEKSDLLKLEYEKLGRQYFEKHKDDKNEDFSAIFKLQQEVDTLENEINAIKETKVCARCGSKQDRVNTFCGNCGAKL